MIGAEVGNYLRMFRGKLYKRFPGLWRRTASEEEREYIKKVWIITYNIKVWIFFKTSGDPAHVNLPSSISLLKASEVYEVMAGRGARYRQGESSSKVQVIKKGDETIENYASMQQSIPGHIIFYKKFSSS